MRRGVLRNWLSTQRADKEEGNRLSSIAGSVLVGLLFVMLMVVLLRVLLATGELLHTRSAIRQPSDNKRIESTQ